MLLELTALYLANAYLPGLLTLENRNTVSKAQ